MPSLSRLFLAKLIAVAGASLLLAGCNAKSKPPSAQAAAPAAATYRNVPAGVTPAGFRMPQGSGCNGAVARWAAIQDNDLKSGHVSPSVYKTIQGEISQARAACNAGRDAESKTMVRASRMRHGYPAN